MADAFSPDPSAIDFSSIAPVDPTAAPASALDLGGAAIDWMKTGLSKALDTYLAIDTLKAQQQYAPVPAGYYRVPQTGQVVPAGTVLPPSGMNPSGLVVPVLLIVGVILAVKLAKG